MIKADKFINNAEVITSSNLIKEPLVSVIMPTYCRGNNGLLKRSILSVLEQSFVQFELIIVDDGSVDMTREIVSKLMNRDYRIVYIRNDSNSGLPAIRINQAIPYIRGKYVCYQFDDDFWEKDALESLYSVINEVPEPCVVYGKVQYKLMKSKHTFVFGKPFDYNEINEKNRLANNSVMHHRELFYQYGGYDCHLAMRRLCDWDLWLRWAKHVPFIHVDKVVSNVEGEHERSIGIDCIIDVPVFRAFHSIERNNKLLPHMLKEYELDDLSFLKKSRLREAIKCKHILPWCMKHKGMKEMKKAEQPIRLENQEILLIILDNNSNNPEKLAVLKELEKKYSIICAYINELTDDLIDYSDIVVLEKAVQSKYKGVEDSFANKQVILWEGKPLVI